MHVVISVKQIKSKINSHFLDIMVHKRNQQRRRHEIEPGEGLESRAKKLGPTRRTIFEIKPSRMAKNASPKLKFNKLIYRSQFVNSQKTLKIDT